MPDSHYVLVREALNGDASALAELVRQLMPVVQARVALSLVRQARASHSRAQQEVADFTQEVFVQLFADRGRVLLAWDAERGLSLQGFVRIVAQRHIISLLRTQKNPWRQALREPALFEAGSTEEGVSPERVAASREELQLLLDALRRRLSALGLEMFYRLYVYKEPVDHICGAMNMSADGVYQWRKRLGEAAQQAWLTLQRTSAEASEPSSTVTP